MRINHNINEENVNVNVYEVLENAKVLKEEKLLEYLEANLKVRETDPKWVESQLKKYENEKAQTELAKYRSREIFRSYRLGASKVGKITYILWKYNSICELLISVGNRRCTGCDRNRLGCKGCAVAHNAADEIQNVLLDLAPNWDKNNLIVHKMTVNGKKIVVRVEINADEK